MKIPKRDERRADEAAAAWLEILEKGGAPERKAFAAWLKESPSHVRAFLLMTALDIELDGVDSPKTHRIDPESAQVIDLRPAAPATARPLPGFSRSRALLLAACLAFITFAGLLVNSITAHQYQTSVGEQRVVTLPDGSVVYLNTDSRIALDFSKEFREIRLVEGEALFKVAREPSRPFRVMTEDATIEAIGTQFNVRQDSAGTKVAVVEGKVRVADQQKPLVAGEEAAIERNAHSVNRTAANLERTLSWRQRRLMFRTDTLADIAAEFNRYNRSTKIRVIGDVAGASRFSGVFDADDPESLAQVLQGNDRLIVDRANGEILIRSRSP